MENFTEELKEVNTGTNNHSPLEKEILELMQHLSQGDINYEYASKKALGLLDRAILLPSEEEIKDKVAQQDDDMYKHISEKHGQDKDISIEEAATYCSESFDDALSWIRGEDSLYR